jgi:hypothetical protein
MYLENQFQNETNLGKDIVPLIIINNSYLSNKECKVLITFEVGMYKPRRSRVILLYFSRCHLEIYPNLLRKPFCFTCHRD